jgi:hypothetical protein
VDEKMNWGFIILIFLFFMIFGGWGNGGLFGGRGGECAGCGVVSNCQVEKQQIIDTARTQYMIENTAKQTQEQAMALANALGTKIDFYEYQNLRDQLAQERTKNVVLENRVYSDAKFNALERQNEAMFGVLKSEIADLSCNVPKRPPYYAQGFVTCGSPIPNGCCN